VELWQTGGEDFEYFIRAVSGNDAVVFPPTAPEINRSVVICPE
jgi:hypothetical protein